MQKKSRLGFTLVELMIVVAIIGILALVASGKFGQMVDKSKEANTKANLAAIRSAISIYYADNERFYPQDLDALLPKYIVKIPEATMPPNHSRSASVDLTFVPESDPSAGWIYDGTFGSSSYGEVRVNCTHNDVVGRVWTSY